MTDLAGAVVIGAAFGVCLERAGLAHAPKLAAQFYLRDLTVFKVMFSALLTAMLGAFWLDYVGWLDLSLVYLPETFLAPQAIGGALFGAGFVLAGLCPGTSCVAAATGRLDGIAVMCGLLIGIAVVNGAYDAVAPFYQSTGMGAVTLSDVTGVPRGFAVTSLTAMALAGFAGANWLERRRQ